MPETPDDTPSFHPRRKSLTPQQRRLLGTPRAQGEEQVERESEIELPPAEDIEEEPQPAKIPRSPEARSGRKRGSAILIDHAGARKRETQQAWLVIGVLVLIAASFFLGRNLDQLEALFSSRLHPRLLEGGSAKFPGMSAEELVSAALAAEKRGDWQGAADRFVEAKRNDRSYRGILYRLGKNAFDRGDFDAADKALERAISFGEDLSAANYLRGTIAMRRHDYPAAERFFEAAATAGPFVAENYFAWAEALRLNQKPADAIRRYQQSSLRATNENDVTLCRFKIRLARIEAVEGPKVSDEIEAQRKAGSLSADWLMTAAVLQLKAGEFAGAAKLIEEARAKGPADLFNACAEDFVFAQASEKHPEIRTALKRADTTPKADRPMTIVP